MQAKTSKRNSTERNSTNLSTLPRVEVDLPLKYFWDSGNISSQATNVKMSMHIGFL